MVSRELLKFPKVCVKPPNRPTKPFLCLNCRRKCFFAGRNRNAKQYFDRTLREYEEAKQKLKN